MNAPNADQERAAAMPVSSAPVVAARGFPASEPILPERSREDTDAAWGEYPDPADDRLYRDRPPHWDDF